MFYLARLFGRFLSAVHFQVSSGAEDCHLKSVSSSTIQIHFLGQQGYTPLDHQQLDVRHRLLFSSLKRSSYPIFSMSLSSSSDVESTPSESVSELPGYQIDVRYRDILDKDFSLTTVEPGDETDALVERWWTCQPDLLEEEGILLIRTPSYRMEDVRSGQNPFYQTRQHALSRDLMYWFMCRWTFCSAFFQCLLTYRGSGQRIQIIVSKADCATTRPVDPVRFPPEIQHMFIAACAAGHGQLKNLRAVCHDWNLVVLHRTHFFQSLKFRRHNGSRNERRQKEYWLSSVLEWRNVQHTVTSVTMFSWHLDDHCWFLHLLMQLKEVTMIKCGVWSSLYCLPRTVETLRVREMVLQVAPGLYRLCDNRSRLSSLILDRVSVPFIVSHKRSYYVDISDDEKATTVSGPFDDIDGWREDHRFSTMGSTLVPRYSTVLDELVIYDQEDQSGSLLKRIIDDTAGTLEDDIPSHVTLSGDETLTKRLDSSYVSTLRLIFVQNFSVREDIWDRWSESVEDLTIGGISIST